MSVRTEKIIDHQYWENSARSICSNYNQLKADCKCYPNQSDKKPDRQFYWPIIETLKIPDTAVCLRYFFRKGYVCKSETNSRRAERASNLTYSKCLHLVDLNNPRILMTHDKMAVIANIRA